MRIYICAPLFLALIFNAFEVSACQAMPPGPENDARIAKAVAVFRGRVIAVATTSAPTRWAHKGGRLAQFEVLETVKGALEEKKEVSASYDQQDGENCGQSFEVGEEAWVRLYDNGRGSLIVGDKLEKLPH